MNSNELIKRQNTPKKRIMLAAKALAKQRAGIAATDSDVNFREVIEAVFIYLEQMEKYIGVQEAAISKLIHLQEEDRKNIQNIKIKESL